MSSDGDRNDKGNEDRLLAVLMDSLPWLKRDDARELLARNGGDAERVLQHLMEESAEHPSVPPTMSASMQGVSTPAAGEKEKKKTESHFVGGGPSSGQMMLADDDDTKDGVGPGGVENVINSIFDQVRRQPQDESPESVHAFFGRGRRLGHTTTPSPFIAPVVHQQRSIVVTIYRDGYVVDDGPKRAKDSAEGVEFFAALKSGLVPRCIAEMYPNTNISVRLVDYMQHDAPTVFSPFAGEGHRLVDCATTATTTTTTTTATASSSPRTTPAQRGTFQLYEDEETVRLVIVDLLGERKVVTVNPRRHTVQDLFVLAAQVVNPGAAVFDLIVRDVPPRKLKDMSQTIDDAKLRNSTLIMQRAQRQ